VYLKTAKRNSPKLSADIRTAVCILDTLMRKGKLGTKTAYWLKKNYLKERFTKELSAIITKAVSQAAKRFEKEMRKE